MRWTSQKQREAQREKEATKRRETFEGWREYRKGAIGLHSVISKSELGKEHIPDQRIKQKRSGTTVKKKDQTSVPR